MKYYFVNYNIGKEAWLNKEGLYNDFMGDFYRFMLKHTDIDFKSYGITDLKSFLDFSKDWHASGKSDLYGVGDAFQSYYLTKDTGGLLENQPDSTFIGYCFKNNKYTEFIPFQMKFFEYWRTDEGYTTPENHGNDFFHSPWASLVDTVKFFFFTADTLQLKYKWFTSPRVKDALDNIPGVLFNEATYSAPEGTTIILPKTVNKEGFKFAGWYLDKDYKGNLVTEVNSEATVYAKFTQ